MTNEQLVELLQMGIDTKSNMEALYMQNKGNLQTVHRYRAAGRFAADRIYRACGGRKAL